MNLPGVACRIDCEHQQEQQGQVREYRRNCSCLTESAKVVADGHPARVPIPILPNETFCSRSCASSKNQAHHHLSQSARKQIFRSKSIFLTKRHNSDLLIKPEFNYQIIQEHEEEVGRVRAITTNNKQEDQGQRREGTHNNICKREEPAIQWD